MDVGGNKRNPRAVIEMTGTPEVSISIDEFRAITGQSAFGLGNGEVLGWRG